jgi:hypothetical protein
MNIKQHIEISDSEHGLLGIGRVTYQYTSGNGNHTLKITMHDIDKEIKYVGKKAQSIYKRFISDSDKSTLNLIKRLSCEAVGIPLFRLKEKSRKREVVWARNMVMWYANKYMKHSLQGSGDIFGKDHATALHAIREFNKCNKYLLEKQVDWKIDFLNRCNNHNLIF